MERREGERRSSSRSAPERRARERRNFWGRVEFCFVQIKREISSASKREHYLDMLHTLVDRLKDKVEIEVAVKEELLAKIKVLEVEVVQLKKEAGRDDLTGLYKKNRTLFRLRRYLEQGPRLGWWAIVFVDAANFKVINDSLGHHVGDEVIIQVARILSRRLRPHDFIGRMGGDEFLMVLCQFESFEAAQIAVEHIRSSGKQFDWCRVDPRLCRDGNFSLGFDVGVVYLHVGLSKRSFDVTSEDGESGEEYLSKLADLEMYKGKDLRKETGEEKVFSVLKKLENGKIVDYR